MSKQRSKCVDDVCRGSCFQLKQLNKNQRNSPQQLTSFAHLAWGGPCQWLAMDAEEGLSAGDGWLLVCVMLGKWDICDKILNVKSYVLPSHCFSSHSSTWYHNPVFLKEESHYHGKFTCDLSISRHFWWHAWPACGTIRNDSTCSWIFLISVIIQAGMSDDAGRSFTMSSSYSQTASLRLVAPFFSTSLSGGLCESTYAVWISLPGMCEILKSNSRRHMRKRCKWGPSSFSRLVVKEAQKVGPDPRAGFAIMPCKKIIWPKTSALQNSHLLRYEVIPAFCNNGAPASCYGHVHPLFSQKQWCHIADMQVPAVPPTREAFHTGQSLALSYFRTEY